MISPTPNQMRLLRYIAGHIEAKGYAPSFDDMERDTGVHRNGLHDRLVALEERGWIRRLFCRARAIELLVPVAVPRAPDGAPLFHVTVQE